MLRILNVFLLAGVIYTGFGLVSLRYKARLDYTKLEELINQTDTLNKEYTRLQLEEETFSSNLILQDYAVNKLGLVQADQAHIIGIK